MTRGCAGVLHFVETSCHILLTKQDAMFLTFRFFPKSTVKYHTKGTFVLPAVSRTLKDELPFGLSEADFEGWNIGWWFVKFYWQGMP
jgi:hypothetical protein